MRRILYFAMITILFISVCSQNTPSVLVTGHRGASGLAPENTIIAMQKAIEAGAEFSELDVQETSDGMFVLMHDTSLKKTTGVDKEIWEMDFVSLNDLEAGAWFDPEFKGEPIPTLADVMDYVRGKMKLNIEMKVNNHEDQLPERVAALIEEKDFIDECIVTSFDFKSIDKIRALNMDISSLIRRYMRLH